ncbi:hypothetical protein LEP1GSC158_1639 [Leptospira interrogans serovar Zanoni str. LT2156]|uniref:Uncharacterized protein n=1 Tax=Leptospira interrogans serovar Zanoni str. LT2156 TaxID=1001601 RepID=M6HHG4_LEPIR|nr:hypothetical protein LEP1GSC158_1639 [Leptospira interrogans serovar Zanoni str. LT2156]
MDFLLRIHVISVYSKKTYTFRKSPEFSKIYFKIHDSLLKF